MHEACAVAAKPSHTPSLTQLTVAINADLSPLQPSTFLWERTRLQPQTKVVHRIPSTVVRIVFGLAANFASNWHVTGFHTFCWLEMLGPRILGAATPGPPTDDAALLELDEEVELPIDSESESD